MWMQTSTFYVLLFPPFFGPKCKPNCVACFGPFSTELAPHTNHIWKYIIASQSHTRTDAHTPNQKSESLKMEMKGMNIAKKIIINRMFQVSYQF